MAVLVDLVEPEKFHQIIEEFRHLNGVELNESFIEGWTQRHKTTVVGVNEQIDARD